MASGVEYTFWTFSGTVPGEEGTFEWKALNPGLYVYHWAAACARGIGRIIASR